MSKRGTIPVAPATPENLRILIEMDVTAFIALLPGDARKRAEALTEDERRDCMLAAMHKSRYELHACPPALRVFSRKWLEVRNLGRLGMQLWPPEGVLPSQENGL